MARPAADNVIGHCGRFLGATLRPAGPAADGIWANEIPNQNSDSEISFSDPLEVAIPKATSCAMMRFLGYLDC